MQGRLDELQRDSSRFKQLELRRAQEVEERLKKVSACLRCEKSNPNNPNQ